MNERERRAPETPADDGRQQALEERLRAMYSALYSPTFPPVKPSEELQRRVAEITARQPLRPARLSLPAWRAGRWRSVPVGRELASVGALAGAVLVTLLGLTLVRPESTGRPKQEIPLIMKGEQPDRSTKAPRSVRNPLRGYPVAPHTPERRIASTFGGARAASGASLALANHGTGRGTGSRPSPRPQLPPPVPVIDDLVSINPEPAAAAHRWVRVPQEDRDEIEHRVRQDVRVRDDFVQIPFPRIADATGGQIAAAVESYKREAAIVDARLSREVTCAFKATAPSDLCDRLRSDTGIHLAAGTSVADEKVTLLCKEMPLRDVMRQLSRPFGYTWLRTRRPALGSGLWALGLEPGAGRERRGPVVRRAVPVRSPEPRAQSRL